MYIFYNKILNIKNNKLPEVNDLLQVDVLFSGFSGWSNRGFLGVAAVF
jgi:hypothetical protein